jgi:tol-pal system protein YbgF
MISLASISKTTRLAALAVAAGFLFAAPAMAQTALPPPSYGNADARQDRIEELEAQLRDATAETERLQFEIIQRDREIRRLNAMVGELAGVNQDLSAGTPPPAGAAPPAAGVQRPSGDEQSSLTDAQRRATGTLGTVPAGTQPATQTRAAEPAPTAEQSYSRARELLVNGNYAEAEVAFGDFLEAHPNASTAADARFWFAFTQLARNNYQDAASNFLLYLERNGQGPRAPEAQVRLGMALVGMGQTQRACSAFASLARRYPNAARNVRDLAAREARAAQCPA